MKNDILQSMRLMAWERAKGELSSIGQASYGRNENIKLFFSLLEEFISKVEDEALIE